MCMFPMESGFLALLTLLEDGAPQGHGPSLPLWVGGEGPLCLVPN